MSQAKVAKDYRGLRDLVLREQFLQSSGKGLQLFLKERQFTSVEEMAASADRYIEAHDMNPSFASKSSAKGTKGAETGSRAFEAPRGKTCFICKGAHFMRDCPRNKEKAAALFPAKGKYDQGSPNAYKRNDQGKWQNKNTRYVPRQEQKNMSACCLSNNKVILSCGHSLPVMSVACEERPFNMPEHFGSVGRKRVSVLRDTGCSTVVVRKSLVEEGEFTGDTQMCVLIDGTVRRFPTAMIQVKSPFYTGEAKAMCMDAPVYDLIIGNIEGAQSAETETKPMGVEECTGNEAKDNTPINAEEKTAEDGVKEETVEEEILEEANAVQTRAQAKQESETRVTPMKAPKELDIDALCPDSLMNAQQKDDTLQTARELAESGEIRTSGKESSYRYFRKNGILFREYSSPNHGKGQKVKQLVVPAAYRSAILKTAHEGLLGGHLGMQKTGDKILTQFHWPGILAEVKRFCASCDICQRTVAKGKVKKVPLERMPIVDVPFRKVAVDLIGPIAPMSERGHRYILTIVDYATRYPEAVPLKNIETETVAEAMFEVFTRVGVPGEVLSDQGAQFTSGLMKEVSRLLSLKQLVTTPYHAMCNGLVEKFNGTLKSILKKLCAERPRDWDKLIAPALFAYREAPQASTGFSPFELLYGRAVRGPIQILRELMTKEIQEPEIKTVYHYVLDLRERLEETLKAATEELKKSQDRYKKNFDRKTQTRNLKVGDKALILLPTNSNKLLMQWKGPYDILERIGEVDYKLKVKGKEKIFHANMLKKYTERKEQVTGSLKEKR